MQTVVINVELLADPVAVLIVQLPAVYERRRAFISPGLLLASVFERGVAGGPKSAASWWRPEKD